MKYLLILCLLFTYDAHALSIFGGGKDNAVIVEAGNPGHILYLEKEKDKKPPAKIIVLMKQGDTIVVQDVSGWMAMTPSHWRTIKAKLDAVDEYEKKNGIKIKPKE